jgi:hypothetical protein
LPKSEAVLAAFRCGDGESLVAHRRSPP